MTRPEDLPTPHAAKDEHAAHPVAAAWRPVLCEIVRAFVRGDYGLTTPIAGVAPVADKTAQQIRRYVSDYGATLIELPSETWDTSCAQWMGGYWDVLVDLWTKEEDCSDLVLAVRVEDCDPEPRFTVQLVYVP